MTCGAFLFSESEPVRRIPLDQTSDDHRRHVAPVIPARSHSVSLATQNSRTRSGVERSVAGMAVAGHPISGET
jgi:hypothetical protein